MIQIYHNPRCGKSRNCLAQVAEKESEVSIIKYLETPPTEQEIKTILQKLNFQPIQYLRNNISLLHLYECLFLNF